MKKAYLIHGWGGSPEHGWFPWLKKELVSRGWQVEAFSMPDSDKPMMEKWIPFLGEHIVDPDADTVIVGHSMGVQAALRYVDQLSDGKHVGKLVLVAGPMDTITGMEGSSEDPAIAEPWLTRPIDAEKVKRIVSGIVGIFSDNDRWIPLSQEIVLREHFGARTIIMHDMHHFSGDDGITEVPMILKEVLGE